MANYKTIFVDAQIDKRTYEPNGDQLARDIQAAIVEKGAEGFVLDSTIPILKTYSTITMTSGVVLIFQEKHLNAI